MLFILQVSILSEQRSVSNMAAKTQEGASGVINTARRERLKVSRRVDGCDGWVIAGGHR